MPQSGSPFGGPAAALSSNGTAATTTYYPGTPDEAAAHTVKVAAGETVNDIVFTMQAVPAFRVSGLVVDENEAPVAGAVVRIMGDLRSGGFMGPQGGTAAAGLVVDQGTEVVVNGADVTGVRLAARRPTPR